MDIVLKLRELRRMRGLTQKEVGQSSGVGEKTLSSFETGDRIGALKLTQLLQLLSVYDVTAAEFFSDGVERRLTAELHDFDETEVMLLSAWRALPRDTQETLAARFLLMMEGASLTSLPRLSAVR